MQSGEPFSGDHVQIRCLRHDKPHIHKEKRNLPFNFTHIDVEYFALCQDGRQIPSKAFQPQFNNSVAVREFYNLFPDTRRCLKGLPLCIHQDDFQQGYILFVFNLNPDEEVEALSLISNGNLKLEMRFRVALPHTVTLVVYAAYD